MAIIIKIALLIYAGFLIIAGFVQMIADDPIEGISFKIIICLVLAGIIDAIQEHKSNSVK